MHECESCTDPDNGAGGIPGILFPMGWDTLGDSEDGCVFFDNCESCRLYESRLSAGAVLSALLGKPFVSMEDDGYNPKEYFDVSLEEAEACVQRVRREGGYRGAK